MSYTRSEIAAIYDEFLISNDETLPRGLFIKSSSLSSANESLALKFIKYACESYLGWDARMIYNNLNENVVNFLKLKLFLQYVKKPDFGRYTKLEYIAEKIYPYMRKSVYEQAMQTYDQVKTEELPCYPKDFFEEQEGTERAQYCLQQVLSERSYMFSVRELYEMFSGNEGVALLKKTKLYPVISKFGIFEDALAYLHLSLPISLRSDFWYLYFRTVAQNSEL